MAKITFNKLGLKPVKHVRQCQIGEVNLEVKSYLPISEKVELIQYVVDNALDESTGCFSPVRLEIYFSIGICKWYAGISFTDKQLKEADKTYDLLEENKVVGIIVACIPQDEYDFMNELVQNTVNDIARYNASAAGIIQSVNSSAGGLNAELTKILDNIKSKEGLEAVSMIKDMVGND